MMQLVALLALSGPAQCGQAASAAPVAQVGACGSNTTYATNQRRAAPPRRGLFARLRARGR